MGIGRIVRRRGDSYRSRFEIRDPDGVLMDVSGAEAVFTVREFAGGTVLVSRMSETVTGTDGACVLDSVAFTSASPSAAFTSKLEGNVLAIASGTNDVPGDYFIEACVSGTALTLGSEPATGGAMSAAVYSVGGDITLSAQGVVSVGFNEEAMEGLELGKYVYDLELTFADGTVQTVAADEFVVVGDVAV